MKLHYNNIDNPNNVLKIHVINKFLTIRNVKIKTDVLDLKKELKWK